jgi:magnesium-dependent phosphatase 1
MSAPSPVEELPLPPPQPPSLEALLAGGEKPALVVLDADYTIWPFDCDKNVVAPFSASPYGGVYDGFGRPANPFNDVPAIVGALVDAGIPIAIASRNPSAGPVSELLKAIRISPTTKPEVTNLWAALPSPLYFHAYSSGGYGKGKDRHFATLHELTGIAYKDMLFFDDFTENTRAATAMGITSVLMGKRGLTVEAFEAGLAKWRAKS